MSLTNEQLKSLEFLSGLDVTYSFPGVDKRCNSYLEDYENDTDSIWKLSFSTIPELIDILDIRKKHVKSKKCNVVCAVEAFKNKPQYSENGLRNISNTDMELPEFIYNF